MPTFYNGRRFNEDEEEIKDKFKTIDELCDTLMHSDFIRNFVGANNNIYDFIIDNYPTVLLQLINSPFNKPSRHDLDLIKSINKLVIDGNEGFLDEIYKPILEAYKNREVTNVV